MSTAGFLRALVITLAYLSVLGCTSSAELAPSSTRLVDTTLGAAVSIGAPYVDHRAPLMTSSLAAWGHEDTPDLSSVATELRRHAQDLTRCFERRLLAHPALGGEVVIHWTIAADGQVGDQCITRDTVGDPELLACVNQLVLDGRYTAPGGAPVDVTFPIAFRGQAPLLPASI